MLPRGLIKLADALHMTRWPDAQPRVPILLYHGIARPAERIDPAVTVRQPRFSQQLDALSEAGYSCISLGRLIAYVRDRQPVPPRSFAITFDDGFLNTCRLAWPELARRGLPATVFLVTDLIGRQSEWTRTEPSGPQLMMGTDHIRRLQQAGIDFASHGCTHAHLPPLAPTDLENELVRSRHRLADLLGHEVTTLAYPYGHFDARIREAAVQAGYTAAVSVVSGSNHPGIDVMALRRIVVSGHDTGTALLLKMLAGVHRIRWRTFAGSFGYGARGAG